MRRVAVLVLLCVLVGACTGGGGDDTRIPDLPFDRFDGRAGSLGEYEGTPLVINFFASWCVPCVQEMPDLEDLHQRYGDDVTFLGIAVNDRVSRRPEFVDATGVTYDVGLAPDAEMVTTLGGVVMPTTVVVDAGGRVVTVISGKLKPDQLPDLIADEFDIE